MTPGKALFVFVKNTLPPTGNVLIMHNVHSIPILFYLVRLDRTANRVNYLSFFSASRLDIIYQSFKDDDGFLYMCYSSEKTFG